MIIKKVFIIIMFLFVFACRDPFTLKCDDLTAWSYIQCCLFCHPDGILREFDFLRPPVTGGLCICKKTGKNTMLTLPPPEENKSREE